MCSAQSGKAMSPGFIAVPLLLTLASDAAMSTTPRARPHHRPGFHGRATVYSLAQVVLTAAFAPVLSLALSGVASAQAPSPITFSAGSWHFMLGGYVKLDLIHDFDAIGSTDTFDPRTIPVDGRARTNTRIHARETRLSLGIVGPAEGRDLQL